MINFFKSLYLTPRFFYVVAGLVVLFLVSYAWNTIYGIAWVVVVGIGVLLLFEVIMLYSSKGVKGQRIVPEKFSNSDTNEVQIQLTNAYVFTITLGIVDELPVQFQKRDFFQTTTLFGKDRNTYSYSVRPVDRGEYVFGNLNLYASSLIGLVRRRFTYSNEQTVKVYPSFIQMKKYDFLAIDNRLSPIPHVQSNPVFSKRREEGRQSPPRTKDETEDRGFFWRSRPQEEDPDSCFFPIKHDSSTKSPRDSRYPGFTHASTRKAGGLPPFAPPVYDSQHQHQCHCRKPPRSHHSSATASARHPKSPAS